MKPMPREFEDLILKCGFDARCDEESGTYQVTCPEKPTEAQLLVLRLLAASAGWKIEFSVGPKPETREHLINAIAPYINGGHGGVKAQETAPRRLLICTTDDLEVDDGAWGPICEVLVKDPYFFSWTFKDRVFDRAVTKDLNEHVKHDRVVDPLDIKILLGACQDSGEFLRSIGGNDEACSGGERTDRTQG